MSVSPSSSAFGQQHPRGRAFACAAGERLKHAGLELRAQAPHGPQSLCECRFAQLLERVDAEL